MSDFLLSFFCLSIGHLYFLLYERIVHFFAQFFVWLCFRMFVCLVFLLICRKDTNLSSIMMLQIFSSQLSHLICGFITIQQGFVFM